MMSVESSPVNTTPSLNWADIEVEDNPYEQDDDAFIPASSTSTTSSSSSSGKSSNSKKKNKNKKSKATKPAVTSTGASGDARKQQPKQQPKQQQQQQQPPKSAEKPPGKSTASPSKPTEPVKSSTTSTTTTSQTSKPTSPPSSASKSSKPAIPPLKTQKFEVLFTDITLTEVEGDEKLLEQQKEEIELFFTIFGPVDSIESNWAERSSLVVYQHPSDAKNALTQFKSVSKLEDHLTALQARRPKLVVNLKNIWNIKAIAKTSPTSTTTTSSAKPKPSGSSSSTKTPAYPPPPAPTRHHLFSAGHQHQRSPRGEWRPAGFSRSQSQQSQQAQSTW